MTTEPIDYTGTLFWPECDNANPFQTRHPGQGQRATEALWNTLCNLQEQAAAKNRTTARQLLSYKPARDAIADLIELGKAYSDAATRHGKRPLVTEAREIMEERAKRRTARLIGERARDVKPGRVVQALAGRRELRRKNKRDRTRDLIDHADKFRTASGRWAGGNHSIEVYFVGDSTPHRDRSTVYASGGSTSARSRNGKWTGKNSHRHYVVPADWIETVYNAGIANIDDTLTLSAEPITDPKTLKGSEAAWRVTVAQQSTGFDVKTETGFVVMFAGKIHYAKTIAAARKKCANDWKPVFAR